MRPFDLLCLLFATTASAQFQFFDQFFGGQQQQQQERSNAPSDSNWYQQNWEGGRATLLPRMNTELMIFSNVLELPVS